MFAMLRRSRRAAVCKADLNRGETRRFSVSVLCSAPLMVGSVSIEALNV